MTHRTSVITFFLSSKHIIIYDNTTLACLKMVSLLLLLLLLLIERKLTFEYDQMRVTSKIPKNYKQKQ